MIDAVDGRGHFFTTLRQDEDGERSHQGGGGGEERRRLHGKKERKTRDVTPEKTRKKGA